jgi:hypothetical protein
LGQLVRRMVALHVFEALLPLLTEQSMKTTDAKQHETPSLAFSSPDAALKQFSWKPPDLSSSSDWTKASVQNLIAAALLFQDLGPLIKEGLPILRQHPTNYTPEGPTPTHLQLIWWEFPVESWDDIRTGCSMKSLR